MPWAKLWSEEDAAKAVQLVKEAYTDEGSGFDFIIKLLIGQLLLTALFTFVMLSCVYWETSGTKLKLLITSSFGVILACCCWRLFGTSPTYDGELMPEGAFELLRRAEARSGMRFYDLGSGSGKTVVLAWLLGLNATGIEKEVLRWNVSCQAASRIKHVTSMDASRSIGAPVAGIQFIRGNFLEYEFADADIVFMNDVVYAQDVKEAIASYTQLLRDGTRIITAFGLPSPDLEKVETFQIPSTWSLVTKWTLQRVRKSSRGDDLHRHAGVKRSAGEDVVCSL